MTPHAQEPTPVHSNRTGLHGPRGAPGLAKEETKGGGFATMFEGHQSKRRRQTGEGSRRIIRPEAVGVWTSLGGSLSSEWTQPFTGEPIPRLSTMLSSPELNC